MKKRNIAAIGVAATLLIGALSGCSGSGSSKKITIDMFQFKVETKTALDKAVKQFEKENPNITINVQTVGGGGDYAGTLKTKFSSGQEPAIFNVSGQTDVHNYYKDRLVDLSKESWVSKAVKGTLDGATIDGKVYGMPFDLEGYGLLYNKDVFKKAGVDATTIKTFDDLDKALGTIDSQKSTLGLTAVNAFAAKETWITGLHMFNTAIQPEMQTSEKTYNAKSINFTYSDSLKKYVDMSIKYAYKPSGTNSSINSVDYTTQVEQLFALGKVAVIQQGNWVYPTLKGIDANLAANVGVIPIPIESTAGTNDGKIPVGVASYWAINKKKDADTIAACKKFLNWLYLSDEGEKLIVNDFSFIPPFTGYPESLLANLDPISQAIEKYVSAGNVYSWVFNDMPDGFYDKIGAELNKYIAGTETWDQFSSTVKSTWSSLRG